MYRLTIYENGSLDIAELIFQITTLNLINVDKIRNSFIHRRIL